MKGSMCCGGLRITPFCPLCGKNLTETPIIGLLAHCQKQKEISETAYRRLVCNGKTNSSDERKRERESKYFESRRRQMLKWKSWAEALAELLQGK